MRIISNSEFCFINFSLNINEVLKNYFEFYEEDSIRFYNLVDINVKIILFYF